MKILADENIPFLESTFGQVGTLITRPGRQISAKDCQDADMLLVRSVTPVNASLLKNTPIRFVGSATSGDDHLDTRFLDQAGITWATAAGCNTAAVVNYVVAILAALGPSCFPAQNPSAAVIGAGRIGSGTADMLRQLGFQVQVVDPFRTDMPTVPLDALPQVDLITLHTPLTMEGSHPTFHMIQKSFLERQKAGCVLINTGRGAAIHTEDLKQYGQHLQWCLDVFEQEPLPDLSVVDKALIATPHIAGYSVEAKRRGTEMLCEAAVSAGIIPSLPPLPPLPRHTLAVKGNMTDWRDLVLSLFNPRITSNEMKSTLSDFSDRFDLLRKGFPARHEFAFVDVVGAILSPEDVAFLRVCGFRVC